MASSTSYASVTVIPRIAVRLPLALPRPDGGEPPLWIVAPETRTVHVLTAAGEHEAHGEAPLPEPEALAGLAPRVETFFSQL